MLREELQNMQNQPANPQSVPDQVQYDPEVMNNMYYQMSQMQMYPQASQNWDMNNPQMDNFSMQENFSYTFGFPPPTKTMSQFHEIPGEGYIPAGPEYLPGMQPEAMFISNRYSDGSNQQELSEDHWSTRPRARNHLSPTDLKTFLPADGDKKPKFQTSFGINVKNVENLLDDDDDQMFNSGFSGQAGDPNKKVRSVENSGFNSFLGTKQGSGWSDTPNSKFNKTKTTRDSTSFQRSFGSTNQTPDLNTIFETKGGPFFAMEDHLKVPNKDEFCEGFKLVDGPKNKNKLVKSGFQSEIIWENKNVESKYFSNFLDVSGTPSLLPIISKGSEEDKSQTDKQKSNSEL